MYSTFKIKWVGEQVMNIKVVNEKKEWMKRKKWQNWGAKTSDKKKILWLCASTGFIYTTRSTVHFSPRSGLRGGLHTEREGSSLSTANGGKCNSSSHSEIPVKDLVKTYFYPNSGSGSNRPFLCPSKMFVRFITLILISNGTINWQF